MTEFTRRAFLGASAAAVAAVPLAVIAEQAGGARTLPTSFFRPIPNGWKLAYQVDFTKLKALPASEWAYNGKPGGTNGCAWKPSQIRFNGGMVFVTEWNGTEWISAGVGMKGHWPAPLRARVYERNVDFNIAGLNDIDLLWAGPWDEADIYEVGVRNGAMAPSIARIHHGSSANVTTPIVDTVPGDFAWHCHEAEESVIGGVPTYTIIRDGFTVGSAPIPASEWANLVGSPHWLGIQTELYNVGSAPKTAVSQRVIRGAEILVPA